MSVRLKHYLLLLFMTSIAACNDGDPVDTSATMAVAPTVIPYAPGSPSFSLTVNPTTIMAGDVATLTVTALDSHGEPYSSAIKTILFNVSGGTSTGTIGLISPKGNGVYEASITGNISGTTSTIHAIVNGNTIASTGSLTVTTGPAKFVTVVDGNNLAAKVDTPLATNPKVKVTDKYGNAIIGANVDFEVTSGSSFVHDNSSTTYTVTTDANGFSEVPWIMGPTTGATTISATTVVSGGSATNTFSAMVYDKPSIPTLFITGVQGKVDLAWTLTSTGGGSIVYNLYRSNFLAGPLQVSVMWMRRVEFFIIKSLPITVILLRMNLQL